MRVLSHRPGLGSQLMDHTSSKELLFKWPLWVKAEQSCQVPLLLEFQGTEVNKTKMLSVFLGLRVWGQRGRTKPRVISVWSRLFGKAWAHDNFLFSRKHPLSLNAPGLGCLPPSALRRLREPWKLTSLGLMLLCLSYKNIVWVYIGKTPTQSVHRRQTGIVLKQQSEERVRFI